MNISKFKMQNNVHNFKHFLSKKSIKINNWQRQIKSDCDRSDWVEGEERVTSCRYKFLIRLPAKGKHFIVVGGQRLQGKHWTSVPHLHCLVIWTLNKNTFTEANTFECECTFTVLANFVCDLNVSDGLVELLLRSHVRKYPSSWLENRTFPE